MSNQPPTDSSGSLDHLTMRYLRQALDDSHPLDEPYVLNEVEAWVIGRVRWRTLLLATVVGAAAVLLYYLPHFFWTAFFGDLTLTVRGIAYAIPAISILYGTLLIYVEVHALMYINLNAIDTIMAICQFPRAHDARYEQHLRAIAQAALTTQHGSIFTFQSEPHFGRPGWGLASFFWLNLGKAMGLFALMQLTVSYLFPGAAFGLATMFFAIPLFAGWNLFASFLILREAQVRVMAPLTIRSFVDELYEEWGKDPTFCAHAPAVLACMHLQKRHFNYAHHLLVEAVEHRFGIRLDNPDTDVLNQPPTVSAEVRQGLERLIIFAVLIDGRLSRLEKKCLQHLRTKGWVTYLPVDVKQIGRQYNNGKGLWV